VRYYVVHPTNARSVAECIRFQFGVLLSPLTVKAGRIVDMSQHVNPIPGLPYVIDNGAWACFQAGVEHDTGPMLRLCERIGLEHPGGYFRSGLGRGWLVLPDIVGGGAESLAYSIGFIKRHRGGPLSDQVANYLLAVQDGMDPTEIRAVCERYHLGLFVGGSTTWKWSTVQDWAEIGLDLGIRVHVGRVNSVRRSTLCRDLGVSSVDGSSVTVYSVNAEKMSRAHDGDDLPLPPAGRARTYLNEPTRRRIAEIEPRARHAIAKRRFELQLGAPP
jgi:hypothetical protein